MRIDVIVKSHWIKSIQLVEAILTLMIQKDVMNLREIQMNRTFFVSRTF